jgi:hypothetical protein
MRNEVDSPPCQEREQQRASRNRGRHDAGSIISEVRRGIP